jgi:WD40 repeat protein
MTTGTDGWLRAWDLDLGVVRWQRHRHGRAMRVSLDAGGSLVAAAWDPGVDEGWLGGRVLVADAGTGETVWFKRLAHIKGGTRYAHDGTLSPDGSSIAVVADLARDTGVEIGRIIPLAGHGPSVRFRAPPWTGIGLLAWGPDGRLLSDGAHTWDATTGQLLFTASHEGSIVGVDWSPDGRRIVTASLDGTAKVWEVAATGPREPLVLSTAGGFAPVDDVSFSADGRFVITTSDVMRIWDAEPVGDADVAGLALPTTFEAQVAFKPSSSQLVVSSDAGLFTWRLGGTTLSPLGPPRPVPYWTVDVNPVDGSILRVDARSLSVLTPSEVRYLPVKGVLAAAWTPDGDHLVATSTDRSVALIDRDGHELWRTTMAHPIAGLRVGNDGRVAIAQGSEQDPNGGVVILDGHDGSVIATIPVRANALAFDAESSRIFVRGWGSLDPLTVWNADTGQQTDTLPLVAAQVSSIALSPDGSSLAVMAKDGLVRVYGANSGEVMVTLPSRSQVDPGFGTCFSQSMAFNPDGSRLATQGCDGVRVWVVDVDDLLAIARAEVTRSLSPDECRRYLHADPCPPPR